MEQQQMLIQKAIRFAAMKHNGGVRKGTDIPYIVHPFEVAMILQENGADEETIAAGLLHDTLEDTDTDIEEISTEFGEKVAKYVLGASEELEARKSRSWKERKSHTLDYLKGGVPREIMMIACADKLSNIRSIESDLAELQDKLWDRFNQGYEEQAWYYKELMNSLRALDGLKMYHEFCRTVERVFI